MENRIRSALGLNSCYGVVSPEHFINGSVKLFIGKVYYLSVVARREENYEEENKYRHNY